MERFWCIQKNSTRLVKTLRSFEILPLIFVDQYADRATKFSTFSIAPVLLWQCALVVIIYLFFFSPNKFKANVLPSLSFLEVFNPRSVCAMWHLFPYFPSTSNTFYDLVLYAKISFRKKKPIWCNTTKWLIHEHHQ